MNIVMTGATNGFGEVAAKRLIQGGDHHLFVGARNVADALPGLRNVTILPLDLADLDSVRDFCAALPSRKPIDALVLNAGVQLSEPRVSVQGYELTFAVNHLAHFLILDLLKARLAPRARVIVTSSGTHDPEENTPVVPPDHAIADLLAHPEHDERLPKKTRPKMMRAYSSSKLCNILMVKELAKRQPDLSVMAFDPGFVPGTGLMREHPRVLVAILSKLIPLFLARGRSSTIERSGAYLADLVSDTRYNDCSAQYWAVRDSGIEDIDPSTLARDKDVGGQLWEDSLLLISR